MKSKLDFQKIDNDNFLTDNDIIENFNQNPYCLIDIDEQIRQLNNIQAEPNQDIQDNDLVKPIQPNNTQGQGIIKHFNTVENNTTNRESDTRSPNPNQDQINSHQMQLNNNDNNDNNNNSPVEIKNTFISPTKTNTQNDESSNKQLSSSIKNKYKSASGGKSKIPLTHRNESKPDIKTINSKFDKVDIQSRIQNNSKKEGLNRSFSN